MNYVLYLEFCHSINNKVHFHSVFNPAGTCNFMYNILHIPELYI